MHKNRFLALLVLIAAAGGAEAQNAAKAVPPAPKKVYAFQAGESLGEDRTVGIALALGGDQYFLAVQKADGLWAVQGDKKSGPYQQMRMGSFESDLPAFVAKKADASVWAVVGDKEAGPFKDVGDCLAAKGGSLFTAQKADGSWWAVADGKEYGPYSMEFADAVRAEQGWAAIARNSKTEAFVLVNGKTYGPYASCGDLGLNKAGFAYSAKKPDGSCWAVVNGKEYGPYPGVWDVKADQAGFGFLYQNTLKGFGAKVYGKDYGPYEGDPLELRLENGSFGYGVRKADGSMFLVVNGKNRAEEYASGFVSVMALSKAGWMAEVYKDDTYLVLVNGKEYPAYAPDCMTLRGRLLDSGAWWFEQAAEGKGRFLRFSDGTEVGGAAGMGQLKARAGKSYCAWFTVKDGALWCSEKELK